MTSPATTTGATPAPRYLCDRCGRRLTAAQALLAHVADPSARRPAICPGVPQPIGRDQLVPVGAGEGEQGGDAGGHENNVRSIGASVTANADVDGSHAFAREAACHR